jgi:hypothetical protein
MSTSAAPNQNCQWCGQLHPGVVCSRIAAIEYQPDGVTVKRIEFHPPAANFDLGRVLVGGHQRVVGFTPESDL